MHTLYYERANPGTNADTVFSAQEIRALCLREGRPTTTLTVHEAVTATARLGGYLARSRDGPPGIKAVWTGFQALQYIVEGMLLAEQGDVGKG